MEFNKTQGQSSERILVSSPHHPRLLLFRRMVTGFAIAASLAVAAQTNPPSPDKPLLLPNASRASDANDHTKTNDQQSRQKDFEAANTQRKKQIADDSALLLKLAADLKAEVDKTNKDTLSLAVIRKADAIERLAREVKEKMKLAVGGAN